MKKTLLAVAAVLVALAAAAPAPTQETTCSKCISLGLDCCTGSNGTTVCC